MLNQTGRQGKVVEWVRQANYQIQADNPDWSFLRTEFSGVTQIGVMKYAPASIIGAGANLARWIHDSPDYQAMSAYDPNDGEGGIANEYALQEVPYATWRSTYFRGSPDQAKTVYWAAHPDNSFLIGPPPDKAYTIRGEYQQGPQTLLQDADVPLIPDAYQDAITWRACMMLALHDEAPAAYQGAAAKYGPILANMVRDLLPPIETAGNALDS